MRGAVQPLFLAQKGMEHIMSTELLSTPQSIHDSRPQIHPTVGPSHGAAPPLLAVLLVMGATLVGLQQPRPRS